MTLQDLNKLSEEELSIGFKNCCGSRKWTQSMVDGIPYGDAYTLIQHGQSAWYTHCDESDWLEAFSHHPRIGNKVDTSEKLKDTRHLALGEQSGVEEDDAQLIRKLNDANIDYETKFGFTFIVCATGKSGREMLHLLEDRLNNSQEEERTIAMGEQWKITVLRLQKWLDEVAFAQSKSHITTHILDTSAGKPAANVAVQLYFYEDQNWKKIASGRTNADGRIVDLLPPAYTMEGRKCKLEFTTADYFATQGKEAFFPEVQITFNVKDTSHYHVPLLLNPFGYSTYRGS